MIGKKINQLATELAPTTTDLTIIGDPISGVSKKITLAQLGAIFSGAVSFYNDFASFPATGDINVIYCAKDTQKLYLWSGSAYVEVFPSQSLLDTYQLRSEKGVSNGYASLDSGGKVPISQLPSSIMEYKGTWNAATNTPTLANGTGDTGDVYLCNVAGTVNFGAGPITFAVGDYVIYSGSIWQRSSGAVGTVTSVAASITGDAIGITGSPITTSGTLALAFGGNSTQYINGAGNLVTFPGVINEAQNLITEVYNKTGATLTKGTVVYINGGQGNLPTITKALATGDSTSAQTYGIVRNNITNNNNGYVVVAGRISDLDTQAYTEGTQLYLSPTTAGTYTSTKPYAPNHLVYVGIVVRAHPTQGVVEVKIQNGYELDELHNVSAQSPTNNDGIFYNSATSLWEKKSIATVLGYTPQAQLNGTGFVKASGTTISYDNSTYVTTDTFQTISASKTFGVGFSLASAGGTNQLTSFVNTNSLFSGSAGSNVFGFNSANNIYFGKGLDNGGVLQWNNSVVRYYTLPDATGTIALVGGSGVGTVTSVAALTLGTSGTDLSSTVANGTTTPVITLNVPTASATNRGVLSAADWTKFNNNIPAGTPASGDYIFYNGSNLAYRGFIATAPLSYNSSTATFSISQASGSANGFLSSTDWTTFNNKQSALTNPVTGTGTTNYLPKFTGTSTIGNSLVFDNGTNVGIGTATPDGKLDIAQGMSDGSTSAFTNPHLALTATSATNFTGFVGMTFATSDSVNYGFSYGALRSEGGVGDLIWRQHFNSAQGTQLMRLTYNGNLGLGVTPSAWNIGSPVIQMGTGVHFFGAGIQAQMGSNNFYNGSNYIYSSSNFASRYFQNNGQHIWDTAPSGTAGNAISFTQAMTLNASGNLSIGNTNDTYKLDVSGTGRFSGSITSLINIAGIQNQLILENLNTAEGADGNSIYFKGYQGSLAKISAYGIPTQQVGGYLQLQSYSDNTTANIGLIIHQNGNVGIGTTSPANTLHVAGVGRIDTGLYFVNGGTGGAFVWNIANESLRFGTNDTERMRITSGGNVEIATGSIKTGEPDTGWGRAAIKIGAKVSGEAFNVDYYLPISVDGTVYYINLNSSTP